MICLRDVAVERLYLLLLRLRKLLRTGVVAGPGSRGPFTHETDSIREREREKVNTCPSLPHPQLPTQSACKRPDIGRLRSSLPST